MLDLSAILRLLGKHDHRQNCARGPDNDQMTVTS
jgi:hypothetical protein